MIASFVFHFVFVILASWILIVCYIQFNRLRYLREVLVPVLTLNRLEFPMHRSLLVRTIHILAYELKLIYRVPVDINLNFSIDNNDYCHSIHSLCALLNNKNEKENSVGEKNFRLHDNFLSAKELNSFLILKNKVKKISFSYSKNDKIWKVEINTYA